MPCLILGHCAIQIEKAKKALSFWVFNLHHNEMDTFAK